MKTEKVNTTVTADIPVDIADLEGVHLELTYKFDAVSIASEYPQLNADEDGNLMKVVVGDVAAFVRELAQMRCTAEHLDNTVCGISRVADVMPKNIWVDVFDDDWRIGMNTLIVYANTTYMSAEGKWDPSDSYEVELPSIEKLIKLARKKGIPPAKREGEGNEDA